MRSRTSVALAALIVVACCAIGAATVAAQIDSNEQLAANDPLFDLALAQSQLDELLELQAQTRRDLEDALDAIDGLTIERDFIDLNDQARNDLMQESRTQARNMAIKAYVGVGPPLQSIVVLDAESANDLTYRNGLLRQQAERLQISATTYAELIGQADESVRLLSDSINDEIRYAEGLNRTLTTLDAQIPQAEWVVSIAEINDLADQEFERTGRSEPTSEQWRQLRHCESTETYHIDTGNTFYGAYQFTWETWGTVYGQGNPAHAPPEEQDARARLLYSQRGAQPWPICGRYLP